MPEDLILEHVLGNINNEIWFDMCGICKFFSLLYVFVIWSACVHENLLQLDHSLLLYIIFLIGVGTVWLDAVGEEETEKEKENQYYMMEQK